MKRILLSVLLFLGLSVSLHAEDMRAKVQVVKANVESKANDYVYDEAYGYAVPAGSVCQKYVDIIKTQDAQIKALKQELASLQGGEEQDLQNQLKTKYDKEMKEIDEKRMKRAKKETTNSIIVSDEPVH